VFIDVSDIEDHCLQATSRWFRAVLIYDSPERDQMWNFTVEILGLAGVHDDLQGWFTTMTFDNMDVLNVCHGVQDVRRQSVKRFAIVIAEFVHEARDMIKLVRDPQFPDAYIGVTADAHIKYIRPAWT